MADGNILFYPNASDEELEVTQKMRRRRRILVARVLVIALLMLIIPLAAPPAFALDASDFTEADNAYTGNQAGEEYDVAYQTTATASGVTVTLTASPIAGGGQPTINGTACCSPVTQVTDALGMVTWTVNSLNAGTSALTATVIGLGCPDPGCDDNATADWSAATPTTVGLTSGPSPNVVDTPHTVTANVTDTFGNPVTGTVVTFTFGGTGGESALSPTTPTTNNNGWATFTFKSTKTGTSIITATAGTATATATKVWTPGNPTSLDLKPPTGTNQAGDTHTMTATVFDQFGNTMSAGVTVTFTAAGTGGGETPTQSVETTDGNGQAFFSFTSTKTGVSTITATAGGSAFDTATKTWTPSEKHIHICDNGNAGSFASLPHGAHFFGPTSTTASCDQNSTNEVNNSHTVTITVHDEFNNVPPSGTVVTVTLTFNADGHSVDPDFASTTTFKVTTNAGGWATFTFNSTRSGTHVITGETLWETATVTTSFGAFTKTWEPGPLDHYHIVHPDSAFTFECFQVTVTAHDVFNNQTHAKKSQLLVGSTDLPEDLDIFHSPNSCSGTPIEPTDKININFQKVFSATDRDENGETVFITVVSENGDVTETSGPIVINAPPPGPGGLTISLTPLGATNQVGDAHTVTATVTDDNGPTQTLVDFVYVGTTGGESNLSPADDVSSDSNGIATFTFTSFATGTTSLRARAPGDDPVPQQEQSNLVTKTWTEGAPPPPPGAVTITLSPVTATNQVNQPHTVTANVVDDSGPTQTTINFVFVQSTGGETALSPASVISDGSGNATFSFTSNAPGDTVVRADAGSNQSNEVTKTWTPAPGPAVTITLVPVTATNVQGETHTVTATVTDANGPTQVTVTFEYVQTTGEEQELSNLSVLSNGSGQATFKFTSFATGTTVLKATAQGEESNLVTKTWTAAPAGQPSEIVVTPAEATNVINTTHTVTALVTDVNGDPVGAEDVVFTANGTGGESPDGDTVTTDGSGVATFSFTSTKAGQTTIIAQAGGAQGSAVKNWLCDPNEGSDPPTFGFDIARDVELFSDCDGWVLDGFGGVHPFGNAELVEGLPSWQGFDIARELVAVFNSTGDVTGGYVLDGWGGVHPFNVPGHPKPPLIVGLPYFPGFDISRDVHLSTAGSTSTAGWLLDGYGGMHPFGGNSPLTGLPYFDGFDIAREIAFAPGEDDGQSGGYMLDGWGGMHPFGAKDPLTGLPYFPGNDVANDTILTASESGYMLDAYGGLHPFGDSQPVTTAPTYTPGIDNYKAFDLAATKGVVLNRFGTLFDWFPQ